MSYSAIASSYALSSFPSAPASSTGPFADGGPSVSFHPGGLSAAGSIAAERRGILVFAIPVVGLVTGLLAVVL